LYPFLVNRIDRRRYVETPLFDTRGSHDDGGEFDACVGNLLLTLSRARSNDREEQEKGECDEASLGTRLLINDSSLRDNDLLIATVALLAPARPAFHHSDAVILDDPEGGEI
jgi:hypothetical protein